MQSNTKESAPRIQWRHIALVLLVFMALWLPRSLALTTFVTTDERAWLTRSGNFYRALVQGELQQTYQKEHPGVTIMWAGTAGFLWRYPDYAKQAAGEFGWVDEEIESFLRAEGVEPLDLLVAGRLFIVLSISLILTAAFLLTSRLLGIPIALLAFLLIAFDPFQIGHSRFLHLDGLLSSLMLLSILAFVNYISSYSRRYLVLSAIAAGLAWLTKSPTLFLGPFVVLLVLIDIAQRKRAGASPAPTVTIVLWGGIALTVFVLLWPSMWVNPLGTIQQVVVEALFHASEGHEKPIYFAGEIIRGNPGMDFYPKTYLWRSTPVVLLGLILATWALVRRPPPLTGHHQRVATVLLLFVMLYMLFMNQGAKKFDRYLLPIYAPLHIVAAMGWIAALQYLKERQGLFKQLASPLIASVLLIQAFFSFTTYPYYLSYYNPLMSLNRSVLDVMMIGWGEGLDEAARYLNSKPNAEDLKVMAWYWDGPFSYFFRGESTRLEDYYLDPRHWLSRDYTVLYVNQWQREIPTAEVTAYFAAQTPEKVIEIDGLEYARIYNMQTIEPFDPLLTARPIEPYACPPLIPPNSGGEIERELLAPTWGGAIRLLSYELPQEPVMPGTELNATFNLQSVAPIDRNLNLLLRLVGPAGEVVRQEGWPWGSPTSTWPACAIWPDGHRLTMPADSPAGYYRIELGFYDSTLLVPLPAHDTLTAEPMGENVLIDYVVVGDPVPLGGEGPPPQSWGGLRGGGRGGLVRGQELATLGEKINLLAVQLDNPEGEAINGTEQAIRLGETQTLRLFWQARAPLTTDYTVFVHLYGPDGQLFMNQDQQPQNGFIPTSTWKPQWLIPDDYQLPIPPDAPPGAYTLQIGMYDLQTGQRLPVTARRGTPCECPDVIEVGPFVVE